MRFFKFLLSSSSRLSFLSFVSFSESSPDQGTPEGTGFENPNKLSQVSNPYFLFQ